MEQMKKEIEKMKDQIKTLKTSLLILSITFLVVSICWWIRYFQVQQSLSDIVQCLKDVNLFHRLILAMNGMMDDYIGDLVGYSGEYKEDAGKRYQECFKILMRYGWSYEREEADLVYGNHELYKKES